MAKNICVLCGKSVPFLDRASMPVGGTRQTICPGCYLIYQKASPADREAIQAQALTSPALAYREEIEATSGQPLPVQSERCPLQEAADHKLCSACGGVLERVKPGVDLFPTLSTLTLELSRHDLAVYTCPKCGKVEFYRSNFQPEPPPPKGDPTVTCPTCGAKHSRLLPCPNCGREKEHITLSETRREKKGAKPPWER